MATRNLCICVLICISLLEDIFGDEAISIEGVNDSIVVKSVGTGLYTVNMDENNHGGNPPTPLFVINGVEKADCSKLIVQFTQGDMTFVYTIDDKCIFSAEQTFDYESNQRAYYFKILKTVTNYITIAFTINNIDDEPPQLGTFKCNFNEKTDYSLDNTICSTTLHDPDGWLGKMKITSDLYQDIFAIELREPLPDITETDATAYMYLLKQLNYDDTNFYQFSVQAKDSGNNLSPQQSAVINVVNIRSRPPVWSKITLFDQFNEQTTQDYDIQAIDGDTGIHAEICYRKLYEDQKDENYIEIRKDPTTKMGHIHVNPIDRDKYDLTLYHFNLSAYVCDAEEYATVNTVQYYIIDIDNNPPRIVENDEDSGKIEPFDDDKPKTVKLSYLENYSTSYNFSTKITDIDTGENAQFTVSLENVEDSQIDYTQPYLIVPEDAYRTGSFKISVKDKTFLDFENATWKTHSYYVVSKGKKDEKKTDKMLISVSLIDYNDESPIFDNTVSYSASINETVKKGTEILIAHATDRDAEDKVLKMNIVGTYAEKRLSIDADGHIAVNIDNAFDYDVLNSVYFQVTATDKVNHVTPVPVTITILDVNNKAPVIDQVDRIQIEENQKNGVVLDVTITASDVDTTADLTSTINWDKSKVTKTNSPVEKTDAVKKAMEFLEIENTQTNNGQGLQMKLKVINNNDDNPDKPDFETFDTLYLSIVVEDRNTDPEFEENRFKEGQIVINILDVNDNPPYFPSSNDDSRQVQEMSLKGVSVGSIKAIDVDLNPVITYHCTPEYEKFDWVDVNLTTGALTVKNDQQIDADTDKTYYFNYTCWAYDGVFFSKPLDISIYVIDTNNKVPVIDFPNEVHVKEKSLIDTTIRNIDTSDLDRDEPFHTVNCNFVSDTDPDCLTEFKIDNNVLKVARNGTLDRDERRKTYPCQFECLDNPLNVRSQGHNKNNKSFTIILDDINDHAPVLITTDLKCSENLKKDGEVGDGIIGKDIDDGNNAIIDFTVLSIIDKVTKNDIKDSFTISKDSDYVVSDQEKKVHLLALEDVKGKYGTYEVTLHMQDEGDPIQITDPDPTLTLEIEKWNYHAPSIIFPDNKQYIVLSDQVPGQPLALFNNTASTNLPDFTATDGETDDCSKWDVKFSYTQTTYKEDDIFVIHYIKPCVSQLQINKNFNSDLVLHKEYKLTITAYVKEGTPQQDEASYFTSADISIVFFNNEDQPIFQKNDWSVQFVEFNTTQPAKPLEQKAEYEVAKGLPIFYHFYSENQTLSKYFEVDETLGDLSVIGNLTYDYDREIQFYIVASNDSQIRMLEPRSSLNVTVNFLPRNRRAPQWKNTKFFGAIMPTFVGGNLIVTAQAHDDDVIDQGKLTCSISSEIKRFGEGLDKIKDQAFYLKTEDDTASIFLDFTVETTMTGRFEFKIKVEDNRDDYGNGPFESEADTTIFIITDDNTIDFQFYNDIEDVQDRETPMLSIISDIVGYDAYRQNIDIVTNSGVVMTRARLYFINVKNSNQLQLTKSDTDTGFELVNSETILNIVTNVNTFSKLASTLRSDQKLNLASFQASNSKSGNSEAALKAWLIGVSVVLGILVLLLLITLILKTRQLSNRIKKLTTPQFGSQESGLNRIGINAPTTNKHAIEGSNPVYKNDEIKKPKNMNDFDTHSIRSGDSDLVGIENNPEFDYNFNTNEDKTTYL
ncbi:cadherin-AgCad1-like [Diabrotica undecimpunctata]|uniref:cadherin-AgCad1-like n=1 Tax=Diabrotica undecimpunctata TaxID=50387 RepID=UPI003B63D15E